ncbi:beta-D-glucuronidase [Stieleria bergensis]|uniref:Beta-D-glucuronidase n=2 Tax=Stieleria bergensis TaxID=2528025 RepID=A0A517SWP0_9BACT|nr:beta-D-glucuronidase [Planctomycetes bacterium SV_7m_r]
MYVRKIWGLMAIAAFAWLAACLPCGAETISLNGSWELVFDEQQAGESKEWHLDKNFPASSAIEVDIPCSWETVCKDFEGIGWYRKSFNVPAEIKGKAIRLHFGAGGEEKHCHGRT